MNFRYVSNVKYDREINNKIDNTLYERRKGAKNDR